ncbi:MAG: PqqD family protein [Desulfobacterales bacterium]|nr:PqqD family protein [Desulfobacterales bacterium]
MNLYTKVVRCSEVLTSPAHEELVMFDAEAGKYYGLNEMATIIWNKLENMISIEKLCSDLIKNFEVSEDICQKEVISVLTKMHEKKLITIRE